MRASTTPHRLYPACAQRVTYVALQETILYALYPTLYPYYTSPLSGVPRPSVAIVLRASPFASLTSLCDLFNWDLPCGV